MLRPVAQAVQLRRCGFQRQRLLPDRQPRGVQEHCGERLGFFAGIIGIGEILRLGEKRVGHIGFGETEFGIAFIEFGLLDTEQFGLSPRIELSYPQPVARPLS
jgi:hypothetical protein